MPRRGDGLIAFLDTVVDAVIEDMDRSAQRAEIRDLRRRTNAAEARMNAEAERLRKETERVQQERIVELADKLVQEGKYLKAYTKFLSLPLTFQQRADVKEKIDACYQRLIQQADELLSTASKLIDEESALSLGDALTKMNEATVIINPLLASHERETLMQVLASLKHKWSWYNRKAAVARNVAELLIEPCYAAQYDERIRQIKKYQAVYAAVEPTILDANDKQVMSNLVTHLGHYENAQLCVYIDGKLKALRESYDRGDLEIAMQELNAARTNAKKLNMQFSGISKADYLRDDYFRPAFNILELALGRYQKIRDQEVLRISQRVVLAAIQRFNAKYTLDDLYTQHRIMLINHLKAMLGKFWYKFDQRFFPPEFEEKLIRIIRQDIRRIGWKRWREDRSKSISIKYIEGKGDNVGTLKRLADATIEFTPSEHAPSRVTLPFYEVPVALPVDAPASDSGFITPAFSSLTKSSSPAATAPLAVVVAPVNVDIEDDKAKRLADEALKFRAS